MSCGPPVASLKIVSGGQTGADRGALLAALRAGLACGGWCPDGRLAEDGRVPDEFPLTELPGAGYAERTRQHVIDSDGTVIFFRPPLASGSLFTKQAAVALGKPVLLIDASRTSRAHAAKRLAAFARRKKIATLNVAGPRASDWPGAQAWVQSAVSQTLSHLL
jgi:hypothetical protein